MGPISFGLLARCMVAETQTKNIKICDKDRPQMNLSIGRSCGGFNGLKIAKNNAIARAPMLPLKSNTSIKLSFLVDNAYALIKIGTEQSIDACSKLIIKAFWRVIIF